TEVRPFTPAQIKLLETFADQAVIAIENVRLFQELTEALEQQTATSRILGVIASSPTDIQPVLDAIAASAARLCDSIDAVIYRPDGDVLQRVATFGSIPIRSTQFPFSQGSYVGRAAVERQTIHIHDIEAKSETDFPDLDRTGSRGGSRARTRLAVPLLREGIPIGVIAIRRMEVRPFTDKQIKLLESFADQAVIAIENVRLFNELDARNRDLTEALEQQTATSEILRVISSSPTDLRPVSETILANAARLCEAQIGSIFRFDGTAFRPVAGYNLSPEMQAYQEGTPIRPGRESALRRVGLERRAVHIPDILADPECILPEPYRQEGMRTVLAVPLLKENDLIGAIAIHRREVRPFTDAHIKLVTTFADQAVIAIENVRLFQELEARNRDLTEALEQQTATSEILRVIASSPTDIQPVLDAVAENAARLCEATDALIHRIDGDIVERVAVYGLMPVSEMRRRPLTRGSPAGRAIVDRQTIHVHDTELEIETEFPESKSRQAVSGVRTILVTPLLREGLPIGVIAIRRKEVRPFTDKQITLLKTFADQAVIAIENVRLFQEIGERNAELREALEHQTATAEVLGIISRSPTDVQPVLDAIVESAARVCGIDDVMLRLRDGDVMIARAHFGPIHIANAARSVEEPNYRWVREHGTLHIPDVLAAQNDFPMFGAGGGFRTFLAAPLRQQERLIGTLNARRMEVRPFTPAQIKLLETFADQAVIAIENVRLFQELKESLEQQTATSEILGVIASSPTDIQPVLDVVAENAARLCEASDAALWRSDGEMYWLVASHGSIPVPRSEENRPLSRSRPSARAIIDRETVHVHDILSPDSLAAFPEAFRSGGVRTVLVTPLLREGVAIGAIHIRRPEVRPFTDKQLALLKTFADQAVIAIENVRLFRELGERNAELREALEHQTATAEVLGIISRSPTDVQPVLDAIVESAARVCGIDDVVLRLNESNALVPRAHFGPIAIGRVEFSIDEPQYRWVREHGTLH
ncbi:MAG: GAF domain-containing protein, partial [Gemmatimonadaceae bacterium]